MTTATIKTPTLAIATLVELFEEWITDTHDTAQDKHRQAERELSRMGGIACGLVMDAHITAIDETDPLERLPKSERLQDYFRLCVERDRCAYIMKELDGLYWYVRLNDIHGVGTGYHNYRVHLLEWLKTKPRLMEDWQRDGWQWADVKEFLRKRDNAE